MIEFNPLRTTNIRLPEGAVFVISNCCQEMNKAATSHFNTRVAECRLAAQVGMRGGWACAVHCDDWMELREGLRMMCVGEEGGLWRV